jgi:hypothetical protein
MTDPVRWKYLDRLASLSDFGEGRKLATGYGLEAKSQTEQQLDDLAKDGYELAWVIRNDQGELILIFRAPMSPGEEKRPA